MDNMNNISNKGNYVELPAKFFKRALEIAKKIAAPSWERPLLRSVLCKLTEDGEFSMLATNAFMAQKISIKLLAHESQDESQDKGRYRLRDGESEWVFGFRADNINIEKGMTKVSIREGVTPMSIEIESENKNISSVWWEGKTKWERLNTVTPGDIKTLNSIYGACKERDEYASTILVDPAYLQKLLEAYKKSEFNHPYVELKIHNNGTTPLYMVVKDNDDVTVEGIVLPKRCIVPKERDNR